MQTLREFFMGNSDKLTYFSVFVRVLFSILAGGFIGNERGRHGSAAGLRTHIIVCIGACISSLTGVYIVTTTAFSGDIFRIAAQVISGIGFLGAGMIIVKNTNMITGLTTAAGLWATGAIGVAIGFGFYWGALLSTFACVFTAAFLTRFERERKMSVNLYAEINNPRCAGNIHDAIRNIVSGDVLIETIPAKSGINGSLGFFITISNQEDFEELRKKISDMDGVAFVIPE